MGVKKFREIFKPIDTVKAIDKPAAVDAYVQIFSNNSMQYVAGLTNSSGESTLYLQTILRNVVKRLNYDDIWVFDSGHDANSVKEKGLAERAATKEDNKEEIFALKNEIEKLRVADLSSLGVNADDIIATKQAELNMLIARNPDANTFKTMRANITYILKLLGVKMTHSPRNYDAEQLCVQLCREKRVECVISTDTDVIMYGGPLLYKKVPNKPLYDVYSLDDCMQQQSLTYEQLVEVALVMGCDLCDKTPGVGDKTVIKKIKTKAIKYTQEQLTAKATYMNHTPLNYKITENKRTKESVKELMTWLINTQNFNAANVEKLLGHL